MLAEQPVERGDHASDGARVASRVAGGLAGPCVVSCDNITTIPAAALREQVGMLLDAQEQALTEAIAAAFDLG